MGSSPTISRQKVLAAAAGNSNLLEVLHQVIQTTEQTQSVTGTTPRSTRISAGVSGITSTGKPAAVKSSSPVPAQATGSASLLGAAYVVQLINPGGMSPLSRLQAAQAAGNATGLTALQPITPIYHQIRASTSPAFNLNSNTQTFGGNTGSTQTYWTLTGLGKGTWYFQFRSSYDGANFNTWKNVNSGTALGGIVNQVTVEKTGNAEWALFNLPGSLIVGVGAGLLNDGEILDLAAQTYSSGMLAIAGPNGFPANKYGVFGATLCEVDVQVPSTGTGGIVGTPDFPVEVRMQYGIADTSGAGRSFAAPGIANVFALAFDPTSESVTLYEEGGYSQGSWVVFKLPGGARMAIGEGRGSDGDTIWTPAALSWISSTRRMSICTLTDATAAIDVITGYSKCQLDGTTIRAKYLGPHAEILPTNARWLAIAWDQGADVQTVGGFPFLTIQLQGGHAVIIGAGQGPSGTGLALPAGYTQTEMLGICTPAGSDNSGHHLRGVSQCGFVGLAPSLTYSDNTNQWSGPVNWMLAAWK